MLDEDVGQGRLCQFETANDSAVAQSCLDDQVWIEISLDLHFDVILSAFGHLHAFQCVQPGNLRVVIKLQACHVASVLTFDLAHAPCNDSLTFVDDQDIFAEFLGLL